MADSLELGLTDQPSPKTGFLFRCSPSPVLGRITTLEQQIQLLQRKLKWFKHLLRLLE